MAEYQAKETVQQFTDAVYEVNQTIARSFTAAQERNIRFAQNAFESGIAVLRSHIEATRSLMQQVAEQPQEPQKNMQAVLESAVAAQKRNVDLAQHLVESSVSTLKDNLQNSNELTNTLAEQAREQQKTFWALPYVEAYQNFFYAPLTYYKRALEATQSITEQALDVAEKSARQSLEFGQRASQQVLENTLTTMDRVRQEQTV